MYDEIVIEDSEKSWEPSDTMGAFGSIDAYNQKIDLDVLESKTGDLENVMMIKLLFKNIKSTIPYSVGVIVEHKDNNSYKSFGKGGVYFRGREYHTIIPPLGKLDDVLLYKSTWRVDNEFGTKYPTYNAFNLTKSIEPSGNSDCVLPKFHPIVEWIFFNMEEGWQHPKEYPGVKTKALITNEQKDKGVKAMIAIFTESIPVINLKEFQLKFVILENSEIMEDTFNKSIKVLQKSIKGLEKALKKRKKNNNNKDLDSDTDSEIDNHSDDELYESNIKLKKGGTIYFNLESYHIFRETDEKEEIIEETEISKQINIYS